MAMLMHVSVCRLLELQRCWSSRIRSYGRLQYVLVRRIGTVVLSLASCVVLLGCSLSVCSGQLGGQTAETYKGMVRSDMSKPALILFTTRVHTTKYAVKILAANAHCKYFFKNC
jgi:hypothetical protein